MQRSKEGVSYEHMYSSLLSYSFPRRLIVNASERSNTTKRIIQSSYLDEYVYPMVPDVTVLQLGIVDCFPRVLTNFERRVVHLASGISLTENLADYYINYLSRRRLEITKNRYIPYVSIKDFEANLKLIKSTIMTINCEHKFIIINIPCPGSNLTKRNFDVDGIVRKYNAVLDKVFLSDAGFINLYDETKYNSNLLLEDGYHINSMGHKYIFNALKNILQI